MVPAAPLKYWLLTANVSYESKASPSCNISNRPLGRTTALVGPGTMTLQTRNELIAALITNGERIGNAMLLHKRRKAQFPPAQWLRQRRQISASARRQNGRSKHAGNVRASSRAANANVRTVT
jgi:hypothetical protein